MVNSIIVILIVALVAHVVLGLSDPESLRLLLERYEIIWQIFIEWLGKIMGG